MPSLCSISMTDPGLKLRHELCSAVCSVPQTILPLCFDCKQPGPHSEKSIILLNFKGSELSRIFRTKQISLGQWFTVILRAFYTLFPKCISKIPKNSCMITMPLITTNIRHIIQHFGFKKCKICYRNYLGGVLWPLLYRI